MSVLEEVLRMVLEIINSALANQLVYCPNLVYTLLYKRNVFESFRSNPSFQDIIQNIDMVIGFFTSRLQRVQGLLKSLQSYQEFILKRTIILF